MSEGQYVNYPRCAFCGKNIECVELMTYAVMEAHFNKCEEAIKYQKELITGTSKIKPKGILHRDNDNGLSAN